MSTYTSGIPLANQTISSSQPQIRDNFLNLEATLGNNHFPPTDTTVAERGKHKFSSYVNQAADPATNATEGAVFAKIIGGESNLFWRRSSNGTLTRFTANHTPVTLANGRTILPGGSASGLLMQWGIINATNGVSTPVAFGVAFSGIPFSIQLTMLKDATGAGQAVDVVDGTVTVNGFNLWHSASAAHNIYWLAIGPTV